MQRGSLCSTSRCDRRGQGAYSLGATVRNEDTQKFRAVMHVRPPGADPLAGIVLWDKVELGCDARHPIAISCQVTILLAHSRVRLALKPWPWPWPHN